MAARGGDPGRARLLAGVDIGATFVFAVEGALAGAQARGDVLGLLVVAFATALGGGMRAT